MMYVYELYKPLFIGYLSINAVGNYMAPAR